MKSNLTFDSAFYSSIGARPNNEDAVMVKTEPDRALAVVADGVGGSEYGEVASALALESMTKLQELPVSLQTLEQAIQSAHWQLNKAARAGQSGKTTVAVVWIGPNAALAATVGDSRIYQFRGGKICFRTVDHSVAQMAVFAGEITPDGIRTHPDRNKLTRVLGGENTPRADIKALDLRPGDRLLLCTDGFWGKLQESEMEQLSASEPTAEGWLAAMRRAVTLTESDNHTAAVLQWTDPAGGEGVQAE